MSTAGTASTPASGSPGDPVAGAARRQLLDAAVEHAAHHGVSDQSLRQLASALGTSHRMLIYHFGSKEGLLTEIVRTVESRQRAQLADLVATADLSSADSLVRLWEHLADEALWPWERLFFEVYALALQGRPHAQALLDEAIDTWVEAIAALLRAEGATTEQARDDARLMLAVTRGMLLDLLATGDRTGVDAAMRRFATLIRPEAMRAATPPGRDLARP